VRIRRSAIALVAVGLAVRALAAPAVQLEPIAAGGVEFRASPSAADRARVRADEAIASGLLVAVPPGAPVTLGLSSPIITAPTVELGPARELPAVAAWLDERVRVGRHDLVRIAIAPYIRTEDGSVARVVAIDVTVRFDSAADGLLPRSEPVMRSQRQRAEIMRARSGPNERRSGDPVTAAVAAVAVNGHQLPSVRLPAVLPSSPAAASVPSACSDCLKIGVDADSVYAVDFATLDAIVGYDVRSLDPRNLHLYHRGVEIPIEIEGQTDGIFDPDDRIVFLGERNTDRYTETNVYWLVPEADRGLRMTRRPALTVDDERLAETSIVRGVLRFEEQNDYHRKMPDPDGKDHWMSGYLASNLDVGPAAVSIPQNGPVVNAPHLTRPIPGNDYRLRARVVGLLSPAAADAQSLTFKVNGLPAASVGWAASTQLETQVSQPYDPTLLGTSANVVRIEQDPPSAPFEWRLNYIDWVELDYPRRLEALAGRIEFVSHEDPTVYHVGGFQEPDVLVYERSGGQVARLLEPRRLSLGPGMPYTISFAAHPVVGATSALFAIARTATATPLSVELDQPSSLREATSGPEYVIVAHDRFVAEAAALATLRGGMVVSLTDVYDEFSHGIEDPVAVRDFVALAAGAWGTRYIALVGDASYDYQNHLGLSSPSYVPPSLLHARDVYVEGVGGLRAASDSWFAMVQGGDFIPDVAIGRIPVREPGQLSSFVAKLEAYEAQLPAEWMSRVQLFADDDPGLCGELGIFADDLDVIAARYLDPSAPGILRRYAGAYSTSAAPQRLRGDVLADMNVQGVGLQIYSGHGNALSLARHCEDGNFAILDLDTIDQMNNGPRLPLGVAMTCTAGQFDYVAEVAGEAALESISERYLLDPQDGHIAWLGTTSVLLYSVGLDMTDSLFGILYDGDPVGPPDNRVLGTVALGVMLRQFAERGAGARDAIETMAILGDPATVLQLEEP